MACEAAKASQNAIYASEKLGCEANKSGLRLQCEALKELERQGRDLADVAGDLQISGPVRVCFGGASLSSKLDQINFNVTLSANLSIRGDMEITPLNIPGHLLGCVSSWRRSFSATLSAGPDSASPSANISARQGEDALALMLDADELLLEATMRPGPFEAIFGQHPELVVVCPVLFGVGGTAKLLNAASVLSSGNDLIPELRGHFRRKVKVPVQELRVPAQIIPLGSFSQIKVLPHLEANAVVFTGNVSAAQ